MRRIRKAILTSAIPGVVKRVKMALYIPVGIILDCIPVDSRLCQEKLVSIIGILLVTRMIRSKTNKGMTRRCKKIINALFEVKNRLKHN